MRTAARTILAAAVFTALSQTALADVLGVWFSPRGGCEAAIIKQIDAAKISIDYQMFSFTSKPIAAALIRAHGRGVAVVVVVDDGQAKSKHSQAIVCSRAGIPTYLDDRHALAHNKTRIFDQAVVMLGSYNDSASAENSNAETLILENDAGLVRQCLADFQKHLNHSKQLGKSNALLFAEKLPGAGRSLESIGGRQGGAVGRNGGGSVGLHGAGHTEPAIYNVRRNRNRRPVVRCRKSVAKVSSR